MHKMLLKACWFLAILQVGHAENTGKNHEERSVGSSVNNRPMIGILAEEETDDTSKGDFKISASYVKYIEAAGARAVPIKLFMPDKYYRDLFQHLNGVLFPGGSVNILASHYADTGKMFYQMAMEANDAGDYFPLWGTCLGFQLLTALTSEEYLLQPFDSEDYSVPLNLSQDFRKSKLLGKAPKEIVEYLKTRNLTANFHHYGVGPERFNKTQSLKDFYHVLSTNKDRQGKVFVSTIEAYKYPFYGTQWHPETNMNRWEVPSSVSHTKEAVLVSQYMANFLVSEARKSGHRFPSLEAEAEAMMDNYHPEFTGAPSLHSYYHFKRPVEDTCGDELCCIFPLREMMKHGTVWYAVFAVILFILFATMYMLCTLSEEEVKVKEKDKEDKSPDNSDAEIGLF